MSIIDLFKKQSSIQSAASGSKNLESKENILVNYDRKETFIPNIDFSSASNFAKFGSAYEYYDKSIQRIYSEYPYDGSSKEKILFELSSSYLDKWVFDNRYPKTTGYVNFSYPSWGALNGSITSDGYGLPASVEFIYSRGGLHTASAGMAGKPLYKTFDSSVTYDSAKDRTTTFRLNMSGGMTVEFWLKKDSFATNKTEKEVILDLWNGAASSSAGYGRFTLELSGTANGTDVFRATLQSGSTGFFNQSISPDTITTGSLSSWKHYAVSFLSASNSVTTKFYVDGQLSKTSQLGSAGVNEVGGLINGYIGALQTSPSGSTAAQFAGKLSASLDEFRFWKTARNSEQIFNNYYTNIGAGTNTDDSNLNLGLYYKFNEGITTHDPTDSTVLDYSGRIANGIWTGYVAGSRNTGSAIVSSSAASSETPDPIIYSTHPEVSSLIVELRNSGSLWDNQNTTLLYNRIPHWIRDEDEDSNKNLKFLLQIMSSYFDTVFAQITAIPKLKEKVYYGDSFKPLPFSDRLLTERGITVPNLFVNRSLYENISNRDLNNVLYEKEIEQTKNLIYNNIYNNIEHILKAKGTEKSVRNMLRCFGVDDELVKLNVYTDGGTHYFRDNVKYTTINKNYINFNTVNTFESSIYQTSSINNANTFVTGSRTALNEVFSAFTVEANMIAPFKLKRHEDNYFETNFVSSSIFGAHEVVDSIHDYTWATNELANFQAYLVRDEKESDRAQFVLKNQDGNLYLTSSFFEDLYDNQNWNIAVRVKPDKYPFIGNVITSSNPTYLIDFYGVSHAYNTVRNEFHVSASISYTSGSALVCRPKRLYAGAHLTNFTGSVLQYSDIKLGSIAYQLDYVDNDIIKQHNLDPTNYGVRDSFSTPNMFAKNLKNQLPKINSKALIWNFETVTASDSSGNFIVEDFSSGSTNTIYGWADGIVRTEHRGRGINFPESVSTVVKNEMVFASKKELPEISYTGDNVIIEDDQKKFFIKDDDVSDNFFALEKSMNQVVSEEMMKMFSTAKEFSNLMGKAVDRYRGQYKNINFVRGLFFERVEDYPDFDKFTEYFKWIDDAVSQFVSQLFPVSTRHSKNIADVVESHILERNKYQNKFPIITTHPSTEGKMKGGAELKYNWSRGHAPVSALDNQNCTWQKLRKERTDIPDRESIRKVIITETSGSENTLSKDNNVVYQGSAFAIRNLSKPYVLTPKLDIQIHGGINYPPKKDRDIIYHLTQRHGHKGSYGQPINVVGAGLGTGSHAGIVQQQACDDELRPNAKTNLHLDGFAGRYSDDAETPLAKDKDSTYSFKVSDLQIPVSIVSQSNVNVPNTDYVNRFNSGSILTNIHSDTTTPSNHIPMQGPFAESWVGGHQHRHIKVNRHDASLRDDDTGGSTRNNLDNKYTRPEAWIISIGDKDDETADGAIGFVGSDYGGPYPDPARKSAIYYREERAKRPVNIKNIQYNTASAVIGNFKDNYEVISAGGKHENNLYFKKNPAQGNYLVPSLGSVLPDTTHVMSLYGQAPFVSGNVFGIKDNNRQPDRTRLVLSEEILPAQASGSVRVRGIFHSNSGSYLRFVETTGDQFAGSFHDFIVEGENTTSSTRVATGSSDTQFWLNLTAAIHTATTGSYYTNITTSPAVFGVAAWMTGSTGGPDYLSASVPPQSGSESLGHMDSSHFTWSGWAYWSGSSPGSGQYNLFYTTSPTGSANAFRIVFKDSGLRFIQDWRSTDAASNPGNLNARDWIYNNYHPQYANKWTHVCVTYFSGSESVAGQHVDGKSGDDMVLYLNGISSSFDNYGQISNIAANKHPCRPNGISGFHLLGDPDEAGSDWVGGIDEVMWWNKKLTADEVFQVYNCGLKHSSSASLPQLNSMVGWWPLGDIATDSDEDTKFMSNFLTASFMPLQLTSAGANNNIGFDQGIPASSSFATFNITSSISNQTANLGVRMSASVPSFQCTFRNATDIAGGVAFVKGDIRTSHDVVQELPNNLLGGKKNRTIISSRFSAPGGIEVQSPGYLDIYSREYSVYNSLNYRNLTVRGSGSGEDGSIRVNSHGGRREGLRTLLSRHSGKFGVDSVHGSITSANYVTTASFSKIHRNVSRRPTTESTLLSPVFNEDHNNSHFTSLIPRSEFQYLWVTSSLRNSYSYKSGKQRIYGYAPADGIVSSSVSIGGEVGFVAALNFPTASDIYGE